MERKGEFQFQGQGVTIQGKDLHVGQQAPEFIVQANDWTLVDPLEMTRGKVRIIGSLPSLNTSVCDRETRRFNEEASFMGENIVVMMISMDLPWTQKNWCGAAGVNRVNTYSDHLKGDFGQKYGVLLEEPRIFRRAIFVIDWDDSIAYAAYMPKLGEEPAYPEVLQAARNALGGASSRMRG